MTGDMRCDRGRRELLTRTVPACAMACLGLGRLPMLPTSREELERQEQHKFDVLRERKMSVRQQIRMQNNEFMEFIGTLRDELEEPELIRMLNRHSAEQGRQIGEQQAQSFPDTTFATFVNQYRPPRYAEVLTHEVVEDTENSLGLSVTECVWADVFRDAGLGGEIGHAAVCNMDYHWPTAFNPNFKLERTKTLMQGHDECNHRYVDRSGRA